MIAAVDEGVVENILDIVEGDSTDEAEEPLDPGRDQVAYDVGELEDDELDALADALPTAGIDYAWGERRAVRLRRRRGGDRRAVRQVAAPRRARARGRRRPEGTRERRAAGRRLRRRRPPAARRRGRTRARSSLLTSPSRSTTSRRPYGVGARRLGVICAARRPAWPTCWPRTRSTRTRSRVRPRAARRDAPVRLTAVRPGGASGRRGRAEAGCDPSAAPARRQ